MPVDANKPSPERERTDSSLRTERAKTDQALAERRAAEENADGVVLRARENADAVLDDAREKADQLRGERESQIAPPSIMQARAVEDEALRDERAAADESLRREREENARALSSLLPLERDQTDRYLLTERARADDAVSNRDDFLGIASHDLRHLLGGIVLSADKVARGVRKSGERDDGKSVLVEMDRIQRYAARMNRLIGDLLDVASIDAGKLSMVQTPGDATALIAEAVEMFKGEATAKGLEMDLRGIEADLKADFDHDRMLQVLANVLTNAIKFTAPGGSIRVRAEHAGDDLRVAVTDTGAGIPATMLEAIFERFWQASKADRRGVGLGLYISRSIVLAHGGKIWAESTLGQGTTVTFTLPAVSLRRS